MLLDWYRSTVRPAQLRFLRRVQSKDLGSLLSDIQNQTLEGRVPALFLALLAPFGNLTGSARSRSGAYALLLLLRG